MVRVHDDAAFGVPGGSADGLDEGGLRPEEAFLIRVQYGYERDFRKVQAFSEEVDAYKDVEYAKAQVS